MAKGTRASTRAKAARVPSSPVPTVTVAPIPASPWTLVLREVSRETNRKRSRPSRKTRSTPYRPRQELPGPAVPNVTASVVAAPATEARKFSMTQARRW